MSILTNLVEQNTFSSLPNSFAILFDGHATTEVHYVIVLATYLSETAMGYVWSLLLYHYSKIKLQRILMSIFIFQNLL